ncbi:MAG: DUF3311 domain-containing protein [Candidatus Thermoplasmatota archaeon]|jgi:hypothetical protein|nr:DUF3311 domain-containing protein [Candidatus Thermoplasmatota archaeon]
MSTDSGQRNQGRTASYVAAAILLIIPFFAYVLLFTYDRVQPELLGVPFFYWYQTIWLLISAILFSIAAILIGRASKGGAS